MDGPGQVGFSNPVFFFQIKKKHTQLMVNCWFGAFISFGFLESPQIKDILGLLGILPDSNPKPPTNPNQQLTIS